MLRNTMIIAAVAAILLPIGAGSATAECRADQMSGVWESDGDNLHFPVRVELISKCRPSASYFDYEQSLQSVVVRMWSRCYPRDCKWGRVAGRQGHSGRLVAVFKTFSALRKVEIIPSGSDLLVDYHIDYYSETQNDLRGQVMMLRVK